MVLFLVTVHDFQMVHHLFAQGWCTFLSWRWKQPKEMVQCTILSPCTISAYRPGLVQVPEKRRPAETQATSQRVGGSPLNAGGGAGKSERRVRTGIRHTNLISVSDTLFNVSDMLFRGLCLTRSLLRGRRRAYGGLCSWGDEYLIGSCRPRPGTQGRQCRRFRNG